MKPIENITRHAEVSEKAIEKYLERRAAAVGWPCLKYSSQNTTGFPDRLLLLPGGRCAWVEVKSRGCKPSKLQCLRLRGLQGMGHVAEVVDSREAVDALITKLHDIFADNAGL